MDGFFNNGNFQVPAFNMFGLQRFFAAPNTNKVVVYSKDAAMAQDFGVNTDVICLDQEKPLLYDVTTDANGKRSVQTFQLVPFDEKAEAEKKMEGYVKVDEFNKLLAEVQGLKASLVKKSEKDAEVNNG